MLKKLIRHEWREMAKVGWLLLGVVLVITILGGLGFILPLNFLIGFDFEDDMSLVGILWILVMVSTLMIYVFSLVGVMYGLMIYQGVRFYKTMYGAEGYLTHTLPVKPGQLLLSKIFVSGVWYFLVEISMCLSILLLTGFCLVCVARSVPGLDLEELWYMLEESVEASIGGQFVGLVYYIVSGLLTLTVLPFSTLTLLFGSLTIGQLSKKYKAIMGLLAYFGVCMLNGILGYVISMIQTFGMMMVPYEYMSTFAWLSKDITVLLQAALSVGMFFLAKRILTDKLNME